MNEHSVGKLCGKTFILGGLLTFIPFLLQIILGGTPQEGVHIFTDFANNVVAGGKVSLLYALSSAVGISLLAYSNFTLNGLLQKKKQHAIMGLGTFLFVLSQIGLMVAWAMDIGIIFGAERIDIGNWFIIEMSLFFIFAPISFVGAALISYGLLYHQFINTTLLKTSVGLFGLIAIIFCYTLLTLKDHSAATITPLFISISIGQCVAIAWNVLVGKKMIDTM